MRWRRGMNREDAKSAKIRIRVLRVFAVFLLLVVAGRAAADPEAVAPEAPSRLAAAERTIEAVSQKEIEARARLHGRLRALHKRQRAGFRRMWVDPAARRDWLRARAAAARVVRRDVAELAILGDEKNAAIDARDRARAEAAALATLAPAAPPARRSLARPVAGARIEVGFGAAPDRATGATLASRGVHLVSHPGDPVVAVAGGVVRWSGAVAGRGAAIMDHPGPFTSLLVGLEPATLPVPGRPVERGQELARAADASIYLEIRLQTGSLGEPTDPAPLLAP